MKKLLKKFNKEQWLAIQHNQGPCMVYAGPGSGKTTVIIFRIWYLIKHCNVDPSKILVLTFTKSAAEEMKTRFKNIKDLSYKEKTYANFGTFHSIFFKIIRQHYPYNLKDILSERDKFHLVKNIIKTLEIGNYTDEEYIKDILLDLSVYKSNFPQKTDSQIQTMTIEEFQRVLNYYDNYKHDNRKIDFDDMLTECYILLQNNPAILKKVRKQFNYILIDEFQDINNIQFEIIKLLAKPLDNLFVVGDDDQSIYSFRGARPHFILEFHKIYPNVKKVTLNKNYRSHEKIISTANSLIGNNKYRVHKEVLATIAGGRDIIYLNPKDKGEEQRFIVSIIDELIEMGYYYGDIAIIYRTNLITSSIIDVLLNNGIPYIARDQIYNIYEHWVAKDIIAYIKLSNNLMDVEALKRIINRPTRYITKKALQLASNYNKDLITSLKEEVELATYQLKNIEKLEADLKILKRLNTYQSVQYIRKEMGYDKYLENYCLEKNIGGEKLFEVLDELEEITKKHLQPQKFIQYIKEFKDAIKIRNKHNKDDNKIELLTMHSAKGLEYKVVIIVSAIEGNIPHNKSIDNEMSIEEERRLFYVAVTRAKELLYISSPLYKDQKKLEVSRFVHEIKNDNSYRGKLNKNKEKLGKYIEKFLL